MSILYFRLTFPEYLERFFVFIPVNNWIIYQHLFIQADYLLKLFGKNTTSSHKDPSRSFSIHHHQLI